jgi:hypothetical protein
MKLFYADTETTGLDPFRNEAFQLAFIIEVDKIKIKERHKGLEVTKKTLAGRRRAQAFRELTGSVRTWTSTTLDRQNPEFDVRLRASGSTTTTTSALVLAPRRPVAWPPLRSSLGFRLPWLPSSASS